MVLNPTQIVLTILTEVERRASIVWRCIVNQRYWYIVRFKPKFKLFHYTALDICAFIHARYLIIY